MSLTDPFDIEIRDAIEDAPEWNAGMAIDRVATTCPHCEGSGYFVSDFGPAPDEQACDVCEGSGEFDEDDLGIVLVTEPIRQQCDALLAAYRDTTPGSDARYEAALKAAYPERAAA